MENPYKHMVEHLTKRVEHYSALAATEERADLCRCAEVSDLCRCDLPWTTYAEIVERNQGLLVLAQRRATEWAECNPNPKEDE